jgi:ferredoxin
VSVPCASCHGPYPGTPAKFKGLTFGKCGDCHDDAHVGQLSDDNGKHAPDCAACHDVNSFTPPHFETEQHAKTKFPLTGAHQAAACVGCHPIDEALAALVPASVHAKLRRERRPEVVSLAVLHPEKAPGLCSACHADVHQGQFAQEMQKEDCAVCHKVTSFTDLRFDHDSQSRFPLTGVHKKAACGSCHVTAKIRPDGPPTVRYKPLALTCGGCHPDQHQGQFAWEASANRAAGAAIKRRAAPDCSFCHETTTFKETIFSHDDKRFTAFALLGKHAKLECGACHKRVQAGPGVFTVRYHPLPSRCADCHVDFHKGDFRGFEP